MNGKTNLNMWLVVCVFMLTLSGTGAGRAITVDEDGPADYNKIQEAIDAAVAGDTINVASGTYYENVIVNKQLKLVGDDPNAVIIDSGGMGDAVTIAAGNIRVEGFTIRNATGNDGCGLRLYNCQQNTIIGNTIVDNSYGIRLDRSSDNTIRDNDITSNKGAGISICDSNHTLVSGNRMNANGDFWSSEGFGVVIESSRETQVVNNTLASNCGGIHIKDDSHYNVLRGNVVSSNGGGIVLGEEVYVSRPSDNTVVSNEVTSNDNGIVLVRTSHNAILDNEVSQNSNQGICLQYAPDNTIEDNVVKSNSLDFLDPFACGIYLYRSHSVLITGNKIADNHMFGIFLRDCHDGTIVDNVVKSHKSERGYLGLSGALALDWDSYFNIIRENKIIDNRFGLGVAGRFNKIYRNMFINNEAWNAAAHSSRNSWADESDEPPSGNFWSDYDGADCNSGPDQNIPGTSDGRGDKPYVINEPNNIDYYPLMISYSIAADPCVPIMNEPYTLDVNLTNLLDVDVNFTGAIQVKASPSYASGKLVSRQKGILTPYTIEPNQTAEFKLSFTNDWDWIKPGDCRVIGDLISALSSKFVGWSLVRFIEACYDTRQAVPKVTYTFEPDPNSHPLISFSTRVAVQVPQGKQEALQRSLMLQVLSMSTSLYGLIAGPVSPIFTLTGIVFTVGSIQAYNEAVDPASDYTEIPQPVPMAPPPEIEVLPEGTAKRLALAALELASLQKAYSESYIRYDGARMAGDNEYMERQLTAALKYNDMATEKLQEVQFLSALLTADANMPQLTEDDVLSYRNAVLRDGLSQIQQYVLEQTGLASVKPDVIQLIRRSTETTEQRQLYTDPNALRKYAHAATQARYIEDYALQATAEAEDLTVQPTRDVAVTSVVPSKTAVCQGESVSINVTVENQGTEPVPGFAVTAYRDSEVIANANFEKDPCGTSFDGISDWNHRSSDQYGASFVEALEIVDDYHFRGSRSLYSYVKSNTAEDEHGRVYQRLSTDNRVTTTCDYITLWVGGAGGTTSSSYEWSIEICLTDGTGSYCRVLRGEGSGGYHYDGCDAVQIGADGKLWKRYTTEIPAFIVKSNFTIEILHFQDSRYYTAASSWYCLDTIYFSDSQGNPRAAIETKPVYALASGEKTMLSFNWDTTDVNVGHYTIEAEAEYLDDGFSANNGYAGDSIKVWVPDDTRPTSPRNLRCTDITHTTISLTWDCSTDDVGVAGYKVYRDANHIGWAGTTCAYTDTGLRQCTAYSYAVSAYDVNQNESPRSEPCDVETTAALYLLSPDGGEVLPAGANYTIRWETVCTVGNVKLEYSTNDGLSWADIDTVENGGSYQWLVPDVNSGQCLVRISDASDPIVSDTSCYAFRIYKCQRLMAADLNDDCYVNFVDFGIFVEQWLVSDCSEAQWCEGADLDMSGVVDRADLGDFVDQWLQCGNPYDTACELN